MGLRSNGKGHPLSKVGSFDLDLGLGDTASKEEPTTHKEETAIEKSFNTQRLRDRSQLKVPNYADSAYVVASIEDEDPPRPAKKAKHNSYPNNMTQESDSDSDATPVESSDGISEFVDITETGKRQLTPYRPDLEDGSDDAFYSSEAQNGFNHFPQTSSALSYGVDTTTPYQDLGEQSYDAPHPYTLQEMMYPESFIGSQFDSSNAYDDYQEPETSDSWVDDNAQDE